MQNREERLKYLEKLIQSMHENPRDTVEWVEELHDLLNQQAELEMEGI